MVSGDRRRATTPLDSRGARLMRLAARASMGVALCLILAKLGGWMLTGSASMLSSLADSLLDAFASLVNLLAVHHALKPADRKHRFGHGKAEPLAGLAQAAFITGSGIFVAIEAVQRLTLGEAIAHADIGVAVMLFSLALTSGLVVFQRYVVMLTGSTAIGADMLHYRMDILLNVAVIVALVGAGELGLWWLDGATALAIAGYIGWSAWAIAGRSLGHLMDREFPDDERQRIEAIVMSHPDTLGLHDLRTRRSGLQPFIQLHLELDPGLSLARAHEIADEVEELIVATVPGAEVIIHQDPFGLERPHGPLRTGA